MSGPIAGVISGDEKDEDDIEGKSKDIKDEGCHRVAWFVEVVQCSCGCESRSKQGQTSSNGPGDACDIVTESRSTGSGQPRFSHAPPVTEASLIDELGPIVDRLYKC